ncbi:hypothetical protein [Tepidiforma sp.]|uniref:carboxymuconolactone decarboxylase family protein n=1 Tax=Tepidiforma sp. TaxID=2682230 RepID=UPI002ADE3670|nr:hypothetical protein [Tepidiforma sp.]
MSTVPRVPSAVPGESPAFHTVLAHAPAIQSSFARLYAAFWMDPALGQREKELARIRNARVTACGFCRQVRFSLARDEGLDEATLDFVTDAYLASPLSDREKRILQYTDGIIGDPSRADPALAEALRRDLGDDGLAELTLGVGLFLGLARVLITLGLEPESMPVTVLPTPGSAGYAAAR